MHFDLCPVNELIDAKKKQSYFLSIDVSND